MIPKPLPWSPRALWASPARITQPRPPARLPRCLKLALKREFRELGWGSMRYAKTEAALYGLGGGWDLRVRRLPIPRASTAWETP